MRYSATLDFGNIFGPPQSCPDCGSQGIGTLVDRRDTLFRCRECGVQWRFAQGRAIREIPVIDPELGPEEVWTCP
ncbi:hypothetical protein [Nocardia sp. CA-135398]|uniref:hypothetical protein n=1 Tax=Nocardia sp. CA-135398 TaxID=3239977 RepID=UPI003D99F0F4